MDVELGSMASIRSFAERFLARHPRLDVLIDNAGVMACPFAKTSDGFEMQFGSNHLGHFLLTCLLTPALLRGAPSRIVSVSSRGHHMSPVVFDNIQFEKRPYTANILFAVGLEKRLGSRAGARQCPASGRHHDRARPPHAGRGLRVYPLPQQSRRCQLQDGRSRRGNADLRRHGTGARRTRRPLSRGLPMSPQ
jgi:short subunit dehydrogenase